MTQIGPAESAGFPIGLRHHAIPDQATVEARLADMPDLSVPALAGAVALMQLVERGERLPTELRPDMKLGAALLTQVDIYTTTLRQHPGSRWSFGKRQRTQQQFDTIVDNTERRLETEPSYEGAEDPRLMLMDALRPDRFSRIRIHNVHRTEDGVGGRMYAAHHVEFQMRSEEDATLVAHTFDALLGARRAFRVDTEAETEGGTRDRVIISGGPNEYTVRESGNAACLTGAELLEELYGVVLPDYKVPLEDLEKAGHTVPPLVKAWMQALDELYQAVPAEATYGFGKDLPWVPVPKEKLLVPEVTHVFQVLRDARRLARDAWAAAHPDEEDPAHLNQEQHPNPEERLAVSADTNLVRAAITPERAKLGPGSAEAATWWETWKAETITSVKKSPVRTALLATIKGTTAVLSGGLELLLIPLEHAPLGNTASRWRGNRQERQRRLAEFKAGQPLLRSVITALQAEQDRRLLQDNQA